MTPMFTDSMFAWPLGSRGSKYYEATIVEPGEEISFLIEDDGRAIVALIANVGNGRLDRYGMPAEVLCSSNAPLAASTRAIRETMGEIRRSWRHWGSATSTY